MGTATGKERTLTRRQLLGGAAAVSMGATSGCMQRIRGILNRDSPEAVSLTITAPPADTDRMATTIARHVESNLSDVGISVTLDILPATELYRQVLLNGNYDLFVAQLPTMEDPHALYSLLYSDFAQEPGWQNPYRFTDLTVDGLLDSQRRTETTDRVEAVDTLLREMVRNQPFTTIAFPDEIRAVRTENFVGWESQQLQKPLSYLALERAAGVPAREELALELAVADARLSQNLNPLAIEYRQTNPFTDLVYDPLVRRIDGEYVPWLATDYGLSGGTESKRLTVTLRPGSRWHDGEPITADDVAFTYRFLTDTALGELSHSVPAPVFRAETTLIEDALAIDDTTVELTLEDVSPEVAIQVLTVPLLPEHVWREESEVANIQGIEGSENVTDAMVTSNTSPVGSGPLVVEDVSSDDAVVLEPYDDHFLSLDSANLDWIPDRFAGGPAFDELVFDIVPSNEVAVNRVAQGESDGTATPVDPREEVLNVIVGASGVSRVTEQSASPYHIGFNTSDAPFSNPYFRRLVAQLIDKQHITEEVFRGYGRPASNPFDGTRWSPDDLDFDAEEPKMPFLGTDGEVDIPAAREAFRDHGFEFDDNDTLILQ